MAILLKKDSKLSIKKLQLQTLLGICILEGVFRKANTDLIITCGDNGVHGPGSLHGAGFAVDIRSKHIDRGLLKSILEEAKHALGTHLPGSAKQFDLILEAEGKDNEHFHLEYDPIRKD